MKKTLLAFLILFLSVQIFAQKNTNERAEWFTDARFGMFIHWGLYSGAEGYWKGEKLRNNNDYAEWIYYRNQIEKDEYVSLLDRFNWEDIDPEEWVILAKKAGMKYVTITAKHHDGFSLWDSKVSDYDLGNYTDRDIIKEMAEACKKHGLKLGLYYSHWVDWEHPYGWSHEREIDGITPEEYDQYWQEKVIPQVRELLTNYGDIALMWFDMWINHKDAVVSKDQLLQLKNMIRELQPNCLVNSRLGLSIEEDPDIDFKTLGDNQLGSKKEDFPWQSPATVAHSWGFHSSDTQWKSTSALLKSLIGNASLNGNFMLNIGPRANGDVPFEISQRLLEMGEWLKVNGESVYGSEAFDLDADQHDWGKITCKPDENSFKLYLHVYNWPLNKKLFLTGVNEIPEKIYLLSDKEKTPLQFEHISTFTSIDLPSDQPDPYVSVVVLEYSKRPIVINDIAAKTTDGGYALKPHNQISRLKNISVTPASKYGTVPAHVVVENEQTFKWKVFIDEPGDKKVDVSYSFQGKGNSGKFTVQTYKAELKGDISETGLTVGEPNENWHIENFKSKNLGTIHFPEAGMYDIELSIEPAKNEPVNFQWMWIK
ncbi:alpha-L-fucosidase [Maribellus sediminis]|uniref:alpha-L-fucosidase n=1 Tax=Maribellus sediminis TaxID=2696285 RepID=UPI0014308919|nr:alpha-L-fucosidase [Maribellus sediminis]